MSKFQNYENDDYNYTLDYNLSTTMPKKFYIDLLKIVIRT